MDITLNYISGNLTMIPYYIYFCEIILTLTNLWQFKHNLAITTSFGMILRTPVFLDKLLAKCVLIVIGDVSCGFYLNRMFSFFHKSLPWRKNFRFLVKVIDIITLRFVEYSILFLANPNCFSYLSCVSQ